MVRQGTLVKMRWTVILSGMDERMSEDEGVKKTKSRKKTKQSVRAAVQSARSFKPTTVTAANSNTQAVTPAAGPAVKRKLAVTSSEDSAHPKKS